MIAAALGALLTFFIAAATGLIDNVPYEWTSSHQQGRGWNVLLDYPPIISDFSNIVGKSGPPVFVSIPGERIIKTSNYHKPSDFSIFFCVIRKLDVYVSSFTTSIVPLENNLKVQEVNLTIRKRLAFQFFFFTCALDIGDTDIISLQLPVYANGRRIPNVFQFGVNSHGYESIWKNSEMAQSNVNF